MDEVEEQIAKLESEVQKLQAQKKVTSMSANSGEFLYSNIRFAMQYIDKVAPEIKKSFLQALIKEVLIYDDRIAVNMYLEKPLKDALSGVLPPLNHNIKRPTDDCEALNETARVSNSCPVRLPG